MNLQLPLRVFAGGNDSDFMDGVCVSKRRSYYAGGNEMAWIKSRWGTMLAKHIWMNSGTLDFCVTKLPFFPFAWILNSEADLQYLSSY